MIILPSFDITATYYKNERGLSVMSISRRARPAVSKGSSQLTTTTTTATPPLMTNSVFNLRWLIALCNSTAGMSKAIQLSEHWIVEPLNNTHLDTAELRALAFSMKPEILAICDTSDEIYQECLAPKVKSWKLKLLSLQGVSTDVMADLISKLDFTHLQKIGIRNLSNNALQLLYYKLLELESLGHNNITVIGDTTISGNWQSQFDDLKNTINYFQLLQNNYYHVFAGLIEVILYKAALKKELADSKKLLDGGATEAFDKLLSELETAKTNLALIEAEMIIIKRSGKLNTETRELISVQSCQATNDHVSWLSSICSSKINSEDRLIPFEKYLIIDQALERGTYEMLRERIADTKNQLKILSLSNVSETCYSECLAPKIKTLSLTFLDLQAISEKVMANLIAEIDFSKLQKIALRNLGEYALWLIFIKLAKRSLEGHPPISVFFTESISLSWRDAFTRIREKSYCEDVVKSRPFSGFDKLIQTICLKTKLEIVLEKYKKLLGQKGVAVLDEIVEENNQLKFEIHQLKTQLDSQVDKQTVAEGNLLVAASTTPAVESSAAVFDQFILPDEVELSNLRLELQQTTSKLTQQIEELNSKVTKLTMELSGSNQALTEAKTQVGSQTAELNKLRDEYTKLNSAHAKLNKEKTELANKVDNLTNELAVLQQVADKQVDALQNVISKNNILLSTNSALTKAATTFDEEKTELSAKIVTMTDDLAEKSQMVVDLQTTLDEVVVENQRLEAELATAKREIISVTESNNSLISDKAELATSNSILESNKSSLKRKLAQFKEGNFDDKDKSKSSSSKMIASLNAQLTEANNTIQILSRQKNLAEESLAQVQRSSFEISRTNLTLLRDTELAVKKVKRLETAVTTTKERYSKMLVELRTKITSLQTENDKTVKKHQIEIDKLQRRSQLEQVDSATNAELTIKIASLENELQMYQRQIAVLKKENELDFLINRAANPLNSLAPLSTAAVSPHMQHNMFATSPMSTPLAIADSSIQSVMPKLTLNGLT
jgi:predicted  nucleic acid-binding Zn-ribbon protein